MSLKSRTIKDLTRRLYYGSGEYVEWPSPNELMGIELEAEQVYCELSNVLNMAGWTMDRDGSLRNDGREFVLTQPLAGSSLTRAIHTLFEMQKSENRSPLQYVVNPRAGTHVHINWIEDTVGSAAALIALMYIIEPLVYSWADEDRAWCSYCNPLSDIPASTINKLLRMDVDEEDEWVLRNIEDEDLGRYHGLNIVALAKYGSFEFRYFPSTTAHTDMIKWVKFVQLAKLCAIKYQDDVAVLVERLLQGNIAEFLSEHFGVDGIDAELLTAVNDANSIVIEKAGELGAIMEMRPVNTELFSRNLAPAARRYIERVSGGAVETDTDNTLVAWDTIPPRPRRNSARIGVFDPSPSVASSPVIDTAWFNETLAEGDSYSMLQQRLRASHPELFGELGNSTVDSQTVSDDTQF